MVHYAIVVNKNSAFLAFFFLRSEMSFELQYFEGVAF